MIVDSVGVRAVDIDAGVLRVNHRPVKLHGVNRHDSEPDTGFAVTRAQMLRDLRIMKKHNVNAIRTVHAGLKEFKNVFRPLRVVAFDQQTRSLTLYKYMDFRNSSDVVVTWRLLVDGKTVNEGKVDAAGLRIEPHEKGTVRLNDISVPD